jgi:glucokinase
LSMANVLAGDIGGTTTRLGVFAAGASRPELVAMRTYETTEFAGIAEMAAAFLRDESVAARSIGMACFGAAGPVLDGIVQLTNSPVLVDASVLAGAIGLPHVSLLNDLEALAYALPVLAPGEVFGLQEGRASPTGAIAVIAAGTGLGEAALYNINGRPVARASEGGRADFAARTDRDILVLRHLRWKNGRAAVEEVVSGVGLVNIHQAIHAGCEAKIDFESPGAPEAVSTSALARRCKACVETMETFVEAYGAEAGNLALRTVATGGVFIGGGIAPKILEALAAGQFLSAFRAKAPFTPMLDAMPVRVILNDEAGLLGAANFCFLS